jgi:hypothetical protein
MKHTNDAKENVSPNFRAFWRLPRRSLGEGWCFVGNKDFFDSLKQVPVLTRI